MGAFTSRQNVNIAEEEMNSNVNAYKYPPRSGNNFFGSHFIMGGERFDTPQPEAYLFGENADLNFLGKRPTAFPYPPPQANEPTKTLKSLVNIRKESVRFVRVATASSQSVDIAAAPAAETTPDVVAPSTNNAAAGDGVDGNILSGGGGTSPPPTPPLPPPPPPSSYNIEFTFDSDAKCAITIFYFCTEEVSPSGAKLVSRDGLTSETYHYEKGINQFFSQPSHVFQPALMPEDDLIYNSGREQYPVAIHCVVAEGNEECRQSHTTICVIDHHPESNSYVLRALKQKIFVDGLCYLLQEIYGIENKAVNKSSIDEEIDDHGSECVICMSDTRDTLILPCRHLCLCNSCADSLRYQANNCPICRAPFRALLQIRAVQKGVQSHVTLHQNTPTSVGGEPTPCEQHVPQGYMPVSLIEALNGPPQYIVRTRPNEGDVTDGSAAPPSAPTENHNKATSPLKPNSQRRNKIKKTVSTATNTSEVGDIPTNTTTTTTSTASAAANSDNTNNKAAVVEITNETTKKSGSVEKLNMRTAATSQDKLQIVNERHSLKLPKKGGKRSNNKSASASSSSHNEDDVDEDSENEKLSPLLSSSGGSRRPNKPPAPHLTKALTVDGMNASESSDYRGHGNGGGGGDVEMQNLASLKKHKRPDLNAEANVKSGGGGGGGTAESSAANNAEDSDYYTPEDTQNSILSPLCPDRSMINKSVVGGGVDKLGSLKSNAGSFKGVGSLAKKSLHKKSTSVGNIVGPGGGGASDHLKGNVSSLPDMLDSPISGNSASTRSSSDSYSSSSSTKQLLSSNPTTAAANIIVDDKTALQNAVNV